MKRSTAKDMVWVRTDELVELRAELERVRGAFGQSVEMVKTAQSQLESLRAQLATEKERVRQLEQLIEFYKPSFQVAMDLTLGQISKALEDQKQLAAIQPAYTALLEYAKAEDVNAPEDGGIRRSYLVAQRRAALALAEGVNDGAL